jgi:rubrerythrin
MDPALGHAPAPTTQPRQRWSLDSIDWRSVRGDAVGQSEALFYLVGAASFMESTTDRYTANLIDQFSDDDEITGWLEQHWLPEELQHGLALRRYVQTVWPHFDWDGVYAAFLDEFAAYCGPDVLEPTRTREMASRCVVEMGTAGYYTTLSRISDDPVLSSIGRWIAEDEIRHYKHFYRYFRRYQRGEPASRPAVCHAMFNRLRMIDSEDSFITMKHLYKARNPGARFDKAVYRSLRRASRQLIRPHFPHRMCIQMLLKPLDLGPRTRRIVVPMAEGLARRVVP